MVVDDQSEQIKIQIAKLAANIVGDRAYIVDIKVSPKKKD